MKSLAVTLEYPAGTPLRQMLALKTCHWATHEGAAAFNEAALGRPTEPP